MEKQALKHHISKEKEGSYYRLPLNVPAGMEEMTVRYSYDRSGNNCVDLGLCDEKGDFLGWSGSARNCVTVGPSTIDESVATTPNSFNFFISSAPISSALLPENSLALGGSRSDSGGSCAFAGYLIRGVFTFGGFGIGMIIGSSFSGVIFSIPFLEISLPFSTASAVSSNQLKSHSPICQSKSFRTADFHSHQ